MLTVEALSPKMIKGRRSKTSGNEWIEQRVAFRQQNDHSLVFTLCSLRHLNSKIVVGFQSLTMTSPNVCQRLCHGEWHSQDPQFLQWKVEKGRQRPTFVAAKNVTRWPRNCRLVCANLNWNDWLFESVARRACSSVSFSAKMYSMGTGDVNGWFVGRRTRWREGRRKGSGT